MPNTFSKAKFYVSIPINNSKKKSEKREMLASHLYHHLYCVYIYYYYWPYPIPVNSTYFREQINESTESDVSSLAPHKNNYQHGVRSPYLNPRRSVSSPIPTFDAPSKCWCHIPTIDAHSNCWCIFSCHSNKLMPHTNCWCNFQPHSNNWCHFQLWMHISIIIPTSWCTFQLLMIFSVSIPTHWC